MDTNGINLELFDLPGSKRTPAVSREKKQQRQEIGWNPWHGCHKVSAGCKNCYVYRIDARHERDSRAIRLTQSFGLPVQKKRDKSYRIPSGSLVATCFSSDFFIQEADAWRSKAWEMIRERRDLYFFMITKRIDRFHEQLPNDWGQGYVNVAIGCTVENQEMADYRLPIFKAAPIRKKSIICEPLLGEIDLSSYLGNSISQVIVGGESGPEARPCHYDWVLALRAQCIGCNTSFIFRQTGAKLVKDNKLYRIPRPLQFSQARKAGVEFIPHR